MCTQKHSFHFSFNRTVWGAGSAILVILITHQLLQKIDRCQIPVPSLKNPLPTLIQRTQNY